MGGIFCPLPGYNSKKMASIGLYQNKDENTPHVSSITAFDFRGHHDHGYISVGTSTQIAEKGLLLHLK